MRGDDRHAILESGSGWTCHVPRPRRQTDSRGQSEALAERLREAGGKVTTVHEPDKTHLTINRELGSAGDGPTGKVLEFLAAP